MDSIKAEGKEGVVEQTSVEGCIKKKEISVDCKGNYTTSTSKSKDDLKYYYSGTSMLEHAMKV